MVKRREWNKEKYIDLCNDREIKMYNLRMKGVPYEERLKAVESITKEIEKLR